MAEKGLTDEWWVNTLHDQRFTVANIDLTGLVVKWAMSPKDPTTGEFNPATISVEKNSGNPGEMTLVDGPNGVIDVHLLPADTAALAAIDYIFQLEVFDSGGLNGVVVSEGTATLNKNLVEAA